MVLFLKTSRDHCFKHQWKLLAATWNDNVGKQIYAHNPASVLDLDGLSGRCSWESDPSLLYERVLALCSVTSARNTTLHSHYSCTLSPSQASW